MPSSDQLFEHTFYKAKNEIRLQIESLSNIFIGKLILFGPFSGVKNEAYKLNVKLVRIDFIITFGSLLTMELFIQRNMAIRMNEAAWSLYWSVR